MRYCIVCFLFLLSVFGTRSFIFALPPAADSSFTYWVQGHITSATSAENLSKVRVFIEQDSSVFTHSDTSGAYRLRIPAGYSTLVFQKAGLGTQHVALRNVRNHLTQDVSLSDATRDAEVVVVARKTRSVKLQEASMGVEHMTGELIRKLPTFLGENDVIKAITLLPGVKNNQLGFTVRGGSGDQNLVLLDEAPLYNSSHLLGLFSTFNSDLVKDITLYKGTAPSRFGGRLASVLDVRTRPGNVERFGLRGSIGIVATKLTLETPIQKGKSSFIIGGRRSFIDLFPIRIAGLRQIIYFYDANARYTHKISNKDELSISGYYGRDVLAVSDQFRLAWGNATGTLHYKRTWTKNFISNTYLTFSRFDTKINVTANGRDFTIGSQLQEYNLKQDFAQVFNASHKLRFGIQVLLRQNAPGVVEGAGFNSEVNKRDGVESAIYAEHEWKFSKKLSLQYGLRLSNFSVLGRGKYFELNDQKDIIGVKDNTGGVLSNYFNFEPRATLTYKTSLQSNLKLAFTRNTQHVHLISNSVADFPTDIWIMNTNIIRPEIADQVSAGFVRYLNDGMWEFSLEAYYKWMYNQIDFKDGANSRAPVLETELLFGRGRAYGMEFLFRKHRGKITGWIGYTLSRTQKKINGISNGEWYLAKQDATHDGTLALMYDINSHWRITSIFTYRTGNPVTFPSGKYSVGGETIWLYGKRNEQRLPAYNRLDISATWIMKKRKRFTSELNFGFYNIYSRLNPLFVTFQASRTDPNVTEVTPQAIFPILPTISWVFSY